MESFAAEGPTEIQMHAVAEHVSRVAFPRKPPDASQSMGMDATESKRERQEQVKRSSCLIVVEGPYSSALFADTVYSSAYHTIQTAPN